MSGDCLCLVSVDHLHGEFKRVLDMVAEIKQDKADAAEEAKRTAKERRQREEVHEIEIRDSLLVPDPSPARSRKKKKKEDVNVFQDFGKEHDDAPIQETKVNGMVFYKVNYKRYWQSEHDLQRWTEGLHHNIRYENLLYEVRDRWHEDLLGDRLQLKINHNPLARSRSQRYRPSTVSTSLQLKDLQKRIAPKDNKKKRAMAAMAKSGGGLFGSIFGGDGPEELLERSDLQADDDASEPGDMPDRQSISASSRRKFSNPEEFTAPLTIDENCHGSLNITFPGRAGFAR
ncbi:unnamed protein product [Effrenium voratum]|nr:unnamed protein product [Effrenium voratum]